MAEFQRKRSFGRMLGQGVTTDAAGKQVATGTPLEVRIAYPYIHELQTKTAGGAKIDYPGYSMNVLVPQLNPDPALCANYGIVAAHVMEAATQSWGSWPEGGVWPIENGNVPYVRKTKPGEVPLTAEQIAERNKWRVGYWIIEVSSGGPSEKYPEGFPPQVAMVQNGVEVSVTSKAAGYKSGDHAYVFLHAYTFWPAPDKKFGANFGFNGVIFTRPGERIGNSGQRSVASMFGGVGAGVGAGMAAAAPGPAIPGAPTLPQSSSAPLPPAAPPAPPHQGGMQHAQMLQAPSAPPMAPLPPGMPPAAGGMPSLPIPGR
jgi:hypothetical protein